MRQRTHRGLRALVAATVVGLAAATPSQLARADEVTDDDVAAARAAVVAAAASVTQIEVLLAEQSAALDQAWVAVEVAAEDYAGAVVASEAAEADAEVAAQRAADADARMAEARDELGRIALEANRSSGGLDGFAALLSASDYEDFVARTVAMKQVGARADRAVQRYEAAELVSRTLAQEAVEAAAAAERAAADAEGALAEAQRLQQAAEQQVAQVAAERDVLLARLAELRQTSVEVEQARQAQLEAERRAREDAAAQAGHPTSGSPPPAPGTPPGTPGTPPSSGNPPPSSDPTQPPAPPSPPPSGDPYGLGTGSGRGTADQGASAVAWAVAQVGKPYVYGATGPDSFDCSGLTSSAWRAAGVSINRTSRDQYRQVLKVTYDSMRPGDLIFWGDDPADPGSIHHVAMFIGNGQMVEASRPGVPVRVTAIRWTGTMPYAGRP